MADSPQIRGFFDERTNTVSYLVWDSSTRCGAIVDPVLDYDPASGEIATSSADRMLAAAEEAQVRIELVLETHPHADHLSAAAYLRAKTGARVGIGSAIRQVQRTFAPVFAAAEVRGDGSEFDLLLEDGDRVSLGELTIEVIATPGHTPACVSYLIGDVVFVGDTLFMPDYGTSRTDFPGGDARKLYRSIQKLLALPPETRLLMCHDYKAPGRDEYRWETTVAEERASNVHVGGGASEDDFVAMREARDAHLAVPKLLYAAMQVNIRGGRLPPRDQGGARYLRIPLEVPPGVDFD